MSLRDVTAKQIKRKKPSRPLSKKHRVWPLRACLQPKKFLFVPESQKSTKRGGGDRRKNVAYTCLPVMTTGGLRPRQLGLITEKRSRQRGMKPQRKKRRRQKERAASQSSSTQIFFSPMCSMVCASRSGLYSHKRACQN